MSISVRRRSTTYPPAPGLSRSPSPSPVGAFTVEIPPTLYCAGSFIEGHVILNFIQLQHENIERVIVKFRGMTWVTVGRGYGEQAVVRERREIISLKRELWYRGSASPLPGEYKLRLPFRFHIPAEPYILPSMYFDELKDHVRVLYSVIVTGVRPWTPHLNRIIRRPLAVVSKGNPKLMNKLLNVSRPVTPSDGSSSSTKWRRAFKERQVRRGLFGEHSAARVELYVPFTSGTLPLFTEIPVVIKVKTTTACMSRSKADKHAPERPIFPALELEYYPVHLRLRRRLVLRAEADTKECLSDIWSTALRKDALKPVTTEKEWVTEMCPEKGVREDSGRWVQRWKLQTRVRLDVPPTFSSELVDCTYALWLKVPFPGMGNDVTLEMPITLDSAIDQAIPWAMPHRRSSTFLRATSPATLIGPQSNEDVLGLPPAYWDVNSYDWGVIDNGD
ncbi:hypothetical protein DICSQDRAFT_169156 [Dichomitus squalens LYAD-421 SS1]|uniref:Arrestin-like N-terminal domain-containing protein n=1 Tax=Dichomitus squalens (strain LYAD-421) TaxID=732165 RepID=R7T286_DICSQ|nr:uncharacterized protein DICSQDRAFT_169156 [Dichomitus squalens LYAD-421 SS1]EJF62125.1 hypothetical protein DICSQDRAFT_169156 [Dichomitus squalens LYAD-421 SS1]